LVKIVPLGEIVKYVLKELLRVNRKTYLVGCDEAPQQNKHFLVKRDLCCTVW